MDTMVDRVWGNGPSSIPSAATLEDDATDVYIKFNSGNWYQNENQELYYPQDFPKVCMEQVWAKKTDKADLGLDAGPLWPQRDSIGKDSNSFRVVFNPGIFWNGPLKISVRQRKRSNQTQRTET